MPGDDRLGSVKDVWRNGAHPLPGCAGSSHRKKTEKAK